MSSPTWQCGGSWNWTHRLFETLHKPFWASNHRPGFFDIVYLGLNISTKTNISVPFKKSSCLLANNKSSLSQPLLIFSCVMWNQQSALPFEIALKLEPRRRWVADTFQLASRPGRSVPWGIEHRGYDTPQPPGQVHIGYTVGSMNLENSQVNWYFLNVPKLFCQLQDVVSCFAQENTCFQVKRVSLWNLKTCRQACIRLLN